MKNFKEERDLIGFKRGLRNLKNELFKSSDVFTFNDQQGHRFDTRNVVSITLEKKGARGRAQS